MRNFKVGDIVRVKMLQNAQYHREQKGVFPIPIGTVGKVTGIDDDRLHRIEAIFYVKKVDFNRYKWKEFRNNREFLFQEIYKIIHYFRKKELTRANGKEVERCRKMEENYISIRLAESI